MQKIFFNFIHTLSKKKLLKWHWSLRIMHQNLNCEKYDFILMKKIVDKCIFQLAIIGLVIVWFHRIENSKAKKQYGRSYADHAYKVMILNLPMYSYIRLYNYLPSCIS